jgi:hypothetical protein
MACNRDIFTFFTFTYKKQTQDNFFYHTNGLFVQVFTITLNCQNQQILIIRLTRSIYNTLDIIRAYLTIMLSNLDYNWNMSLKIFIKHAKIFTDVRIKL